jgi:hypothetical protein
VRTENGSALCIESYARFIMTTALARRSALVVGVLLAVGGALWCLAGAGIYGSPLTEMQGEELTRVWAFLLIGPFSALPAAVLTRWYLKAGAAWFVFGGIGSACLAITFLFTDASVFPLLLVSLPMLAVGAGLLLAGSGVS